MSFSSTYRAHGEYRPGWDATVADKQVSQNTSRAVVMRIAHERALSRTTERSAPTTAGKVPDSETAV